VADANELLRRCQRSDESALGLLIELLGSRVFRLAFRVLGDASQADEASADVFVKVWSKCGQWRQDSSALTWIFRVAYRTIVDERRRSKFRFRPSTDEIADTRPTPDEVASERETQERNSRQLQQALSQLTADERGLVHLHYFEGLSLSEIGEIVGATRDALKMRLARTRDKLRELLTQLDTNEKAITKTRKNENTKDAS